MDARWEEVVMVVGCGTGGGGASGGGETVVVRRGGERGW